MEKMDALAKELLGRVKASRRPAGTPSKGVIFAEGDSWFDYWLSDDVLDKLKERYFDVESVAGGGDTLRDMAYAPRQHCRLANKMLDLAESGRRPDVILISGGGNDLAETGVLSFLLNPESMQLPILNKNAVSTFIDVTLRSAYVCLLGLIISLSKRLFGDGDPICILVHGYAYPVPDGQWLKPEFCKRDFVPYGTKPRDMFVEQADDEILDKLS